MRRRRFTGIVPLVVAVGLLLGPLGVAVPADVTAASGPPAASESLVSAGLASVLAQANTFVPSAGMQFKTVITPPNWTPQNASSDILSFDPVRHVMYFPDRVNNAADAIDTRTNTIIGMVPMPADCVNVMTARGRSCPSGIQVAADLRKLIVTDRGSRIFIFDISTTPTPQTIQATLTLPNGAGGADELEYDPLNHRAYVANGSGIFPVVPPIGIGPLEVTVVDVVRDLVLGAIVVNTQSLEQPRFNPVDGMIYQVDSGRSVLLRIDPNQGQVGAIVNGNGFPIPCPASGPTGLDIDPVTNEALVGCGAGDPTPIFDLTTGTVLQTFPQLGGEDGLYFDNNTRRWYTGSQSNPNPNVDSCPADTTSTTVPPPVPVVGVFGAGRQVSRTVTLVGAQCSTANGHSLGVDPFKNDVYVPGRQFPANGGTTGVAVFHDPAAPAQRPVQKAEAALVPVAGQFALGTVKFEDREVEITLQRLPRGTPDELVITTTIGNEVVHCADRDPRRFREDGRGEDASCHGHLLGSPLIRGVVLLGVGGRLVAKGTILRSGGERSDD